MNDLKKWFLELETKKIDELNILDLQKKLETYYDHEAAFQLAQYYIKFDQPQAIYYLKIASELGNIQANHLLYLYYTYFEHDIESAKYYKSKK